jgi:hemoglobin-like flavoprotein
MSIQLSKRTRDLLAQSMPLIEHGKDRLIDGLGTYLRAFATEKEDDSELVAMMLTEMLISQSAQILQSGTLNDAADLKQEHQALDIRGRHYSRFGDALSPVIRDVLGPNVPRSVAAAWGDAFWAIIRTVQGAKSVVYA